MLIPHIFNQFAEISAAQSTRHGGLSVGPYASLNLGKSTSDNAETVDKNREIFFGKLGANKSQVALSYQIHGTEILYAHKPGFYEGYDAIITNTPGLAIGVSIADCCPILIYDAQNKAVAAIHAGWKGTVGAIVSLTLQQMKEQFGSQAQHCFGFIGACISQQNFEVGEEVAAFFDDTFKKWNINTNKFHIDLKEANAKQLLDFGLPKHHIEISTDCTYGQHQTYFSHRYDKGITGRMLAAIMLK